MWNLFNLVLVIFKLPGNKQVLLIYLSNLFYSTLESQNYGVIMFLSVHFLERIDISPVGRISSFFIGNNIKSTVTKFMNFLLHL